MYKYGYLKKFVEVMINDIDLYFVYRRRGMKENVCVRMV